MLLGAPAGREIALRLGARVWVSCHDGAKEVKGLATGWLRTKKWEREDVQRGVCEKDEQERAAMVRTGARKKDWETRPATADPARAPLTPRSLQSSLSTAERVSGRMGTQVLDLASGEEIVLTSEGVWEASDGQLAHKSWLSSDAETSSFAGMGSKSNFHTFDEVMNSVPSASVGARYGCYSD